MHPDEMPPSWIFNLLSVVLPWFGTRMALLTIELAPMDLRFGFWLDPSPMGTILQINIPTITITFTTSAPHNCEDHE